jgi:eukaryotic-like serine/threonine-protein kinase
LQPEFELGALAQPGQVLLGKYRIERVLGVGGMGAVVLATHLQLEERVAIKFLLSSVARQPDMVERFLREGRTAIKIRSEHCVRVLDVGTLEGGQPYMVMEFMEGRDLDATIRESGPLPIADAVDFVLQAGEALAEAHALGTVHRDLKPANLFVTRRADGSPSIKVLDFGISKQAGAAGNMGMTSTQAVMGSPLYMSPEQMRSSKDVDARADIWALGTVLYEAIAGSPPFDGETVTALIIKITQDAVPPMRNRRLDVPPQLEAVIGTALEKDRARRYQTMASFAAALAPFGSASAFASADRIARVLGAPRPPQASSANLAAYASPTSPAISAAQTQGAHAVTAAGTSPRSRGPRIAGAIAGLVAIAVVAGVALLGRSPKPAPSAASEVATPIPAAAPSAAPVALPPAVVLAEPPPPSVASVASAAPVAAPAAPADVHPPVAKPHAPARPPSPGMVPGSPKPPPQSKDVFDDRKG